MIDALGSVSDCYLEQALDDSPIGLPRVPKERENACKEVPRAGYY